MVRTSDAKLLFSCDFSICEFLQRSNDDFDWSFRRGPTPSSGTGPLTDHTNGNGKYAFIEISSPVRNGYKAIGSTPQLTIEGDTCASVSFWYYAHGANLGNFSVSVEQNGNGSNAWTFDGLDVLRWRRGSFMITGGIGDFNVTFEASRVSGHRGDIAVDDILIQEVNCSEEILYTERISQNTCDFQLDMCNYLSASNAWLRHKGPTPSTNTGPPKDNTLESSSGYYVYFDANVSLSSVGPHALISPEFNHSTGCGLLSFFVYGVGSQLGSLSVMLITEAVNKTIWHLNGSDLLYTGNLTSPPWHYVLLPIETNQNFKIGFEVSDSRGTEGDYAIDDISITTDSCSLMNASVEKFHHLGNPTSGKWGQISSPNYPNPYTADDHGLWVVDVKPASYIRILLYVLDIEEGHLLYINDVGYTGNMTNVEIFIYRSKITVGFAPDDQSGNHIGFQLFWLATDHESGNITITTPGLTGLEQNTNIYPSPIENWWMIQSADNTSHYLTFVTFQLTGGCNDTFIKIYNGTVDLYELVGTFCEDNPPTSIAALHTLMILYQTSNTMSHAFQILWTDELHSTATSSVETSTTKSTTMEGTTTISSTEKITTSTPLTTYSSTITSTDMADTTELTSDNMHLTESTTITAHETETTDRLSTNVLLTDSTTTKQTTDKLDPTSELTTTDASTTKQTTDKFDPTSELTTTDASTTKQTTDKFEPTELTATDASTTKQTTDKFDPTELTATDASTTKQTTDKFDPTELTATDASTTKQTTDIVDPTELTTTDASNQNVVTKSSTYHYVVSSKSSSARSTRPITTETMKPETPQVQEATTESKTTSTSKSTSGTGTMERYKGESTASSDKLTTHSDSTSHDDFVQFSTSIVGGRKPVTGAMTQLKHTTDNNIITTAEDFSSRKTLISNSLNEWIIPIVSVSAVILIGVVTGVLIGKKYCLKSDQSTCRILKSKVHPEVAVSPSTITKQIDTTGGGNDQVFSKRNPDRELTSGRRSSLNTTKTEKSDLPNMLQFDEPKDARTSFNELCGRNPKQYLPPISPSQSFSLQPLSPLSPSRVRSRAPVYSVFPDRNTSSHSKSNDDHSFTSTMPLNRHFLPPIGHQLSNRATVHDTRDKHVEK